MRTPKLIALAVAVALVACSKDEPAEVDLGYAYFPDNIGHWVEYQVDSLRIRLGDVGNDTNTFSYTLREELVEAFTDAEGRAAQRIVRYTRDSVGNWRPKDVWWQTRDNVRAERSEENFRRVKLIFPPREGTEWDTNAENVDRAFDLTYEDVDQPFSVNGLDFASTVSVVGTYPNNFINTRHYLERYAKGVGMIVHEVDSIDAQPDFLNGGFLSYDRWYVKYTATAYGN